VPESQVTLDVSTGTMVVTATSCGVDIDFYPGEGSCATWRVSLYGQEDKCWGHIRDGNFGNVSEFKLR
jgi:hypothetical protein